MVPKILKGFQNSAQGWREATTLGASHKEIINPNGVEASDKLCNPVGVEKSFDAVTQGSRFASTLG